MAASYSDGTLKVFNAYTGRLVHKIQNTFNMTDDTKVPINCFKFRPAIEGSSNLKDLLVAVTADGRIQYWNVQIGKCLQQILPGER